MTIGPSAPFLIYQNKPEDTKLQIKQKLGYWASLTHLFNTKVTVKVYK